MTISIQIVKHVVYTEDVTGIVPLSSRDPETQQRHRLLLSTPTMTIY